VFVRTMRVSHFAKTAICHEEDHHREARQKHDNAGKRLRFANRSKICKHASDYIADKAQQGREQDCTHALSRDQSRAQEDREHP